MCVLTCMSIFLLLLTCPAHNPKAEVPSVPFAPRLLLYISARVGIVLDIKYRKPATMAQKYSTASVRLMLALLVLLVFVGSILANGGPSECDESKLAHTALLSCLPLSLCVSTIRPALKPGSTISR
jgi:hypothetical protein